MARYVWAIDVAKSLHPKLHALEVTFRNQLHNALSSLQGEAWYDHPTLMTPSDMKMVAGARRSLTVLRKDETPGGIVAELSFGFWTSLYGKAHEHDIVRPTIQAVLPHFSGAQQLQRGLIAARLREARFLRNRISHLEHVAFDVRLPSVHAEVCEMILWMNREMAFISDVGDDFRHVYGQSWQTYRPLLEARLV